MGFRRYSGPTIHFVDECYDTGKILAQNVVPVFADDSAQKLAARVLHEVIHIVPGLHAKKISNLN